MFSCVCRRTQGFTADTQILTLYKAEYKSLEGLYDLESRGDSQNNFFFLIYG